MTKTISKVGNSHGIIFDSTLMDLARVKAGDRLTVTVHEGGTIILTPIRPSLDPTKAGAMAKSIIRKNSALFKRLA